MLSSALAVGASPRPAAFPGSTTSSSSTRNKGEIVLAKLATLAWRPGHRCGFALVHGIGAVAELRTTRDGARANPRLGARGGVRAVCGERPRRDDDLAPPPARDPGAGGAPASRCVRGSSSE